MTPMKETLVDALAAQLRTYRDELAAADTDRDLPPEARESGLLCAASIWLQTRVPGRLQDGVWAKALPEWSCNATAPTA